MKAPKQSNNTERMVAPEGNHVARLVQMYNLGSQEYTYQGEEKMRYEIRLGFELPTQTAKFGDSDEEKPYIVSKSASFSMHPKAFLRSVVEACENVKLRDDEAENFDVESIMGKACLVNVKNGEGDYGKYAYIDKVTPLPSGMEAPAQINESKLFNVSDYTQAQYDELPDWLQEKVRASKAKPTDNKKDDEKEINPDDIPF